VEILKDSKSRLLKTKAALEDENARLKKVVDRLQLPDNLYVFMGTYIKTIKLNNILILGVVYPV